MTVLVSGATGFLGTAFLRTLDEEAVLVIRGRDHESRAARVSRKTGCRVRSIQGDVTQPSWGLSDDDVASLRGDVRAVVNLAGDVSWSAPWSRLCAVNIDGARHGALLAAALDAQLLHAGSLYAGFDSGREVPQSLLRETEDLTKYERTKLRGEWAVADVGQRQGVPVTICRIPALSGDLDVPTHGDDGSKKVPLARLISSGWWPVIPYAAGARLDICPRDLVAQAMQRTLGAQQAGDVEVRNLGQAAAAPFVEAFAREAKLATAAEPSRFPRPVRTPASWLMAISRQADRLEEDPRHAALIGLRYFSSPTVYEGEGLGREYSIRSLLSTLGMPRADHPPALSSYYVGWDA